MSWMLCDICGQPNSISWSNENGLGLHCDARPDLTRPLDTDGRRPAKSICEKWVPRVRVSED